MAATEALLELVFVGFRDGVGGYSQYKCRYGRVNQMVLFSEYVRCLPQSFVFVLFCGIGLRKADNQVRLLWGQKYIIILFCFQWGYTLCLIFF